MTVKRMRREMDGEEYAGWVALHNLRIKEEKRQSHGVRRKRLGR